VKHAALDGLAADAALSGTARGGTLQYRRQPLAGAVPLWIGTMA
jgi:hypothetical protein